MRQTGYLLYPIVALFLLVSALFSQPAQVNAQDWQAYSKDVDGDGLSNTIEQSGWYNATGGPYVTNYLDMDSDDDGLTDGQEKLYETNPFDDRSPGIYIEHEEHFKTREYFPWQRYGSKYIALAAPFAPSGEQSAVVRRGTTVSVGGPPNAQIQISKSIGSLTTLTAVQNPCSGRWDIQVPSDGTVGAYTVTLQDGGWSKSLNLYVIFQLPTGQSSAFVDAFVTNDNPYSSRDDRSVNHGENNDPDQREYTNAHYGWIPEGEWVNHNYGWVFRNQQYEDFVFEDHVMQVINGKTNTWEAANALGQRVDELTCVRWPRPLTSAWCVLNPSSCSPYTNENQCTNISDLLTAFNRSAGIPARPVATDLQHDTFDHSTEIWTKRPSGGSYDWYLMRGYDSDEGTCESSPYYTGGYVSLRDPLGWYDGSKDQGVFDKSAQTGKIVKKGWWETRFVDYWGWPSEPEVTGSPPGDWPDPPASPTVTETSAGPDLVVQFGQVVADYGVDLEGDGRFDQLVFQIEVNAVLAGDYWIRGALGGDFTLPIGSDLFDAVAHVYLTEGYNVVELPFDGMEIYMLKADGPYDLEALWATDVENPIKSDFAERELGFAEPAYKTSPYGYSDFGLAGATLSGDYNHYTVDTGGDGKADGLVVETGLNVERSGTYTVQGVLTGGQDEVLAQATWTGSGPTVTLQFEGLRDTSGPYELQHLHVRDAGGQVTDGIREPVVLGEVPELSAKPVRLGVDRSVLFADPAEISVNLVVIGPYSDTRVDTDGDGQYDQLVITVPVEVKVGEGGQPYRVEGWLADKDNNLISWASSASQVLGEGVHNLPLVFDGQIIHQHGVDGPYTLMALKALEGSPHKVVNMVDIAYTTPAYDHGDFEEAVPGSGSVSALDVQTSSLAIFEDDMESGTGKWESWSSWVLRIGDWRTYTHAWQTLSSGSLTTKSMDLSSNENPELSVRFRTCYAVQGASDVGRLEVSADGGSWTQVAVYGNGTSTPHWSTERVDLSAFNSAQTLKLRFRADPQSGLLWAVDDVYVTAARFVYLPLIMK
jgi:hypothetical protein